MKKKSGAFIYFFLVIFISVALSGAVMIIANDAFALTKSGEASHFSLAEDTDVYDTAKKLKKEGYIRFPLMFTLYMRLKNVKRDFPSGDFSLSPAMSYDEIRYELFGIGKPREQVRITIPEGYTTDEIIELFLSNGIGTREGFVDVIENYDFDYDFVRAIEKKEGRRYRLDGYLFPDTYNFYSDSSEVAAIDKLLSNFSLKMSDEMISDAERLGFTLDEIVTLASIVQKEAYYMYDMAGISSVFHNRLFGGMKYLQSDATALYGENYDTYENAGLPVGAVSNPGFAAIDAALHPANTKYYYFVTGKDKKAVFSKTYKEHLAAVNRVR